MRMSLRIPLLALALFATAPALAASLRYTATLSADARTLAVELCATGPVAAGQLQGGRRAGTPRSLQADPGVEAVQRGGRISYRRLDPGRCLRYRVDARAATESDRYRVSWRSGHYLMLRLGDWLWRPATIPAGSEITLALPAGWSASVPWPPLDDRGRRYALPDTSRHWDGFSAFGRFEEWRLALPGGRLRIAILPTAGDDGNERLREWLRRNIKAALTSSGRLPLPDAQVLVVPLPGVSSPAPWGHITRGGGSALRLFAGLEASDSVRLADWTLSHELGHLFHPYLGDRGRWMAEGLASYFQNVLRARSGLLTPEQAWSKLDAGFGRGRDERRTRGQSLAEISSNYRGTMRVYWSGAAYWLEADARLREHHGTSLDAVLAAFAERHLPAYASWPPERFAAELDRLAGTGLFEPMYRRYAGATHFPDLNATYRHLGLGDGVRRLRLSADAPAAAVRDAIMSAVDGPRVASRPAPRDSGGER